ncbi:hypothetical protein [Roseicyclus sp.]
MRRNTLTLRERVGPALGPALALGLALFLPLPARAEPMNISQFVFLDRDGDGVFDAGDRPLAGVPVTLETEAGPITRASNLNGFANFQLSPEGTPGEAITAPGEITPRAPRLRGLLRTTPEPRGARVRALPGSPSGLVIDPPFAFLGYAVQPVVEVHLPPDVADDALYCTQRGQVTLAWQDEDRRICAVPPEAAGAELVLSLSGGDTPQELARIVPGFRRVVAGFSASAIDAARAGDAAETAGRAPLGLDFEGIIAANDVQELPAHPAGLVFHNLVLAHRLYYRGYGYVNATTSGEVSVYTSSGHPARITGTGAFEMASMSMGVAWPEAQQAAARVTGYRGGERVAELALSLGTLHPAHVLFFWGPVDAVRISHDLYWQVVLDDITLHPPRD